MHPCAAALDRLLRRDLASFIREVEAMPDDASLWTTLPGISNGVGNLALHVAGNLRHFLGAVLAGDPYRRDREREFGCRAGSRAEVVAELREAELAVGRGLAALSDAAWEAPFPEVVRGVQPVTATFLAHVAVHLGHHLGQAGYLRRILTGKSHSLEPMSLIALAD